MREITTTVERMLYVTMTVVITWVSNDLLREYPIKRRRLFEVAADDGHAMENGFDDLDDLEESVKYVPSCPFHSIVILF